MIEPRAGLNVGLLDFSRTHELIALGYERAVAELERHDYTVGRATGAS